MGAFRRQSELTRERVCADTRLHSTKTKQVTELEVLVPFSALAAAVLVWRHFAKRFADRHAFLRHLAGASTGFAAFIATLAFWFEVTTDPAQSNTTTPALSKE